MLKGGELREGEWVHVAVTHKPLAQAQHRLPRRRLLSGRRGFPAVANATSASRCVASRLILSVRLSRMLPHLSPASSNSLVVSHCRTPLPRPPLHAHTTRPGRLDPLLERSARVCERGGRTPILSRRTTCSARWAGCTAAWAAFYLLADVLPADLIASLHAPSARSTTLCRPCTYCTPAS